MLNLVSYTNNISSFSRIDTPRHNSTEDVLDLIKSLRDKRSEDIQDRVINDLRKKERTYNKNNTANKRSRKTTELE